MDKHTGDVFARTIRESNMNRVHTRAVARIYFATPSRLKMQATKVQRGLLTQYFDIRNECPVTPSPLITTPLHTRLHTSYLRRAVCSPWLPNNSKRSISVKTWHDFNASAYKGTHKISYLINFIFFQKFVCLAFSFAFSSASQSGCELWAGI